MPQTTPVNLKQLAAQPDLPALPQVSAKLLAMLDDPKVQGKQVSAILRADPALAGRTLKMVNSPFYAVRKKVTSINQALALLGFRQVRAIVLGAAVDGLLHRACRSPEFNQQAFSLHAVASAAIAQHLARVTKRIDPESAFSLGLLHDLGKLAIDQCFPESYGDACRKAQCDGTALVDAERALERPTHAQVGAALMSTWGLHESLVAGTLHHHTDPESPLPDVSALMALTHFICRIKNAGSSDDFSENRLNHFAWQQLELSGDALPGVLSDVDTHISAVREMFDI